MRDANPENVTFVLRLLSRHDHRIIRVVCRHQQASY